MFYIFLKILNLTRKFLLIGPYSQISFYPNLTSYLRKSDSCIWLVVRHRAMLTRATTLAVVTLRTDCTSRRAILRLELSSSSVELAPEELSSDRVCLVTFILSNHISTFYLMRIILLEDTRGLLYLQ